MSLVPDLPLTDGISFRLLDVPGGALAVHDADPVGERRGTVLMVPGFTGSKEDFRLILEPLAAQALVLPATVLLSWGLIGRVMGFHAAGGRS